MRWADPGKTELLRWMVLALCGLFAAGLLAELAWLTGVFDIGRSGIRSDSISAAFASAVSRTAQVPPTCSTLADYQVIWSVDWRRPLVDPLPPRPQVEKTEPKPLLITLMGTVVEAGNCFALLRDASGGQLLRRVGQTVSDGYSIRSIEPGKVVLAGGQTEVTLSLKSESKAP